MSQLRVAAIDNNSITFADPADISHTTRVKQSRTDKNVEGVKLVNNRFEVIENARYNVTVGSSVVPDVQSIRLSISGATISEAELIRKWTVFKKNVDALIADGALQGFLASPNVVLSTVVSE